MSSISSVGSSTAALQQLLSHSAPVTDSDAVDKAAKDAVQAQPSKPVEKPSATPAPRPGGVDKLA